MEQHFSVEKIEKLKRANQRLLLDDKLGRDIIFVYCPPKVGSTSLVSSLRIFGNKKYIVLHVHNEKMLEVLYDIKDITINEIIQYNSLLGKRIFVFDVYRHPVEHKISIFFEKLEKFHSQLAI